ncbi:Abi family protein [Sinomicrobium kalidii]|uniref:Abi family protein n=1 Tax=Sinomicrobium kalidii TaxID=2900738 RepID=UPI001E3147C7|nr:Abi family protein [Sinomicrobium kalidii]UGU18099.1 Abi family protein [Sinomicrobium kalidii]
MRYTEFESILTPARMSRYVAACQGNTKKAMTLYRLNLRLSQELFTVISCFEVTLRNAIDSHCLRTLGSDWLKTAASRNGVFDTPRCKLTATSIREAVKKLNHSYTHNKLVAELGFGFWRYMFAQYQYRATGKTLLKIFPAKPTSTPTHQYNQNYIFNQLAEINNIRNRVAHHEPICFMPNRPIKDTTYARQHYVLIRQLFQWMNIDEAALLYGLDHINTVCRKIDDL